MIRMTYIKSKYNLLFFLIVAIIVGCDNNSSPKAIIEEGIAVDSLPSLTGENINTIVSDSGRISYRMEAPILAIYDKVKTPYWNFPEGVHMTTYSKMGKDNGAIKSKFAIYHVEKKLWELRKNVVVTNPDGKTIETELLYWDQDKKSIYSDAFVKITDDGTITKGTGFKSDESFEAWTLDDFEIEYIEE